MSFKFESLALKSVNFNYTLAVCSWKFEQAKTHFLSNVGEKNMCRPGFETTISRSEVDRANHITPLVPFLPYNGLQKYLKTVLPCFLYSTNL